MKTFIIASICSITLFASAQPTIPDYPTARDVYFWKQVYRNGGETIYCAQKFSNRSRSLNVEHVYPASWIARAFGCKNRNTCPKDIYHSAAADLHNLWPSRADINQARSNYPFGELEGEKYRIKTSVCPDFEKLPSKTSIVEPRDDVKGDIARTIFYMELAYDLPLVVDRRLLLKWHKEDKVDDEEIRRNKVIGYIQKRLNPYIYYKKSKGRYISLEPKTN